MMSSIFNLKIFEIRFKVILLIQGHPGSIKTCEGAGQVCGCTQAPPNSSSWVYRHDTFWVLSIFNFKIFEIRFKVILLIQGHPGSIKTCEGAGQVCGCTQAPPNSSSWVYRHDTFWVLSIFNF